MRSRSGTALRAEVVEVEVAVAAAAVAAAAVIVVVVPEGSELLSQLGLVDLAALLRDLESNKREDEDLPRGRLRDNNNKADHNNSGLRREGLCRGDADLRPRMEVHARRGLARDR